MKERSFFGLLLETKNDCNYLAYTKHVIMTKQKSSAFSSVTFCAFDYSSFQSFSITIQTYEFPTKSEQTYQYIKLNLNQKKSPLFIE